MHDQDQQKRLAPATAGRERRPGPPAAGALSPEEQSLAAIRDTLDESPRVQGTLQLQRSLNQRNETGMPDDLKAGIENLSGVSLDAVRVHYNSPQPAQLQALAYAQGTSIHVAPGQEHHLPHEAWHVVQQMQGRVPAKKQLRGMSLNDDPALEREAEVMGTRALRPSTAPEAGLQPQNTLAAEGPIQLMSDEERVELQQFIRAKLAEGRGPADEPLVQQIMNAVDQGETTTLLEAEKQASKIIQKLASRRPAEAASAAASPDTTLEPETKRRRAQQDSPRAAESAAAPPESRLEKARRERLARPREKSAQEKIHEERAGRGRGIAGQLGTARSGSSVGVGMYTSTMGRP